MIALLVRTILFYADAFVGSTVRVFFTFIMFEMVFRILTGHWPVVTIH